MSGLCLLTLALVRPAVSEASPILIVSEEPELPWLGGWAEALHDEGHRATYAGNKPWPTTPDPAAFKAAQDAYDAGINLFLELELKEAAERFKDAYGRFERLLNDHPLHAETSRGSLLAGFYWTRALVESGDKRGATRALAQFIEEHPTATPDPSIFPPGFRELVDSVKRSRNRRGSSDLALEVVPANARVTLGNILLPSSQDGAFALSNVSHGNYRLAVGLPGLGMREQTVRVGQNTQPVRVDLLAAPAGLAQPSSGQPWPGQELRGLVRDFGAADTLIWITDARSVGLPQDHVAYIQEIGTGQLTGIVVIDKSTLPRNLSGLARATSSALQTTRIEVLRVTIRGVSDDDNARQILFGALDIKEAARPGLEDIIEDDIRTATFGLHVGTGIGLAVHVSQPGFAPTPILMRPDIAFALSENIDLGLGARIQITKPTALGEPYLQWRAGVFRLRGGVAIGEISQTITDTENRDRSTQRWVGPSASIGLVLGPVQLSAGAITTLFPDQSAQFDSLLGLVFDL